MVRDMLLNAKIPLEVEDLTLDEKIVALYMYLNAFLTEVLHKTKSTGFSTPPLRNRENILQV